MCDWESHTGKFWPGFADSANSTKNLTNHNIQGGWGLSIPKHVGARACFRESSISFNEFQRGSSFAQLYESILQLMLRVLSDVAEDRKHISKIRAFLEWVKDAEGKTIEYRFVVLYFQDLREEMDHALTELLAENESIHKRSADGTHRGPDPLKTMKAHQRYRAIRNTFAWLRGYCEMYHGAPYPAEVIDRAMCGDKNCDSVTRLENGFSLARMFQHGERFVGGDSPQRDADAYMRAANWGTTWTFPHPERVIEISMRHWAPDLFVTKYFPDYQFERIQPILEKLNTREKDGGITAAHAREFHHPTLKFAWEEHTSKVYRDDFRRVASMVASERLTLERLEASGAAEAATKRADLETLPLSLFESVCWSAGADISVPGRRIVQWGEATLDADPEARRQLFRPHAMAADGRPLSIFAQNVVRKMHMYEDVHLFSTAHKPFFLMNHLKYDAYRHKFNLHFNVLCTGQGATSKSFCFECLVHESIPRTVEELTYQTTRADAIDEDRNDEITLFHETPAALMHHQKGGVISDAEASFKEKLTRLKTTVKTFERDEDTKVRTNRVVESESVGVFMGATNDNPSNIDPALLSRFCLMHFDERARPKRNISDLISASAGLSKSDGKLNELYLRTAHEEQYRIYMVEKAIQSAALPPVSMDAVNLLIARLEGVLQTTIGVGAPHPRNAERVRLCARTLAILHAIDLVYNTPGGAHAGQVCAPATLGALVPHLWVTEEVALFAITTLFDQYYAPHECKIMQLLFSLWRSKYLNHELKAQDHPDAEWGDGGADASQDAFKETHMLFLRTNIYQLADELYSVQDFPEGKIAQANILAYLESLKRQSVLAHEAYDRTAVQDDLVNGFPHPLDRRAPPTKRAQAMVVKKGQVAINFASVCLVHDERGRRLRPHDLIKRVLHKLMYANAPTTTYLIGRTGLETDGDVTKPHLFQTIDWEPNPDSPMTMSNPLFIHQSGMRLIEASFGSVDMLSSSIRTRSGIAVERTLDDYALEEHCVRNRLLDRPPSGVAFATHAAERGRDDLVRAMPAVALERAVASAPVPLTAYPDGYHHEPAAGQPTKRLRAA